MISAPVFRFDVENHIYTLDGVQIPSVTQLIERGGLVTGSDFFTEASRNRGTEIHALCANHDMGVDLSETLESSPHRGYVLAYIAAVSALRPAWDAIEETEVHPGYRFAGRIDRVGTVNKSLTVCEIKSGVKAKHHAIQTALQRLLMEPHWPMVLPVQRLTIYLKHNGRFSVERHEDRRDFDVALKLIKEFC